MSSIVSGYEYDIFISYRHKDNKTGWVTEFVERLKNEIEATFKEDISIYFDSNTHDGLHETHDVDGSLKDKVKCLIFIPIISQTYCDINAFAWQKEFLPFLDFAKKDQFGLDVKLTGGNVSKRILPIKIHDIDVTDKSLIEAEVGGVMRPVEFIYKESGVNRPLKSTDDRSLNQNNTDYANQINKVSNAIKDIINSLKSSDQPGQSYNDPQKERIKELRKVGISHSKKSKLKWIGAAIVLLISIALYFLYSKEAPVQEKAEVLGKSIAVLPFEDMSPRKDQEYLGDGLAEEILNVLAQVKELKVIGRTSSFSYKGKNTDLRTIGEELGVATILEGSVRKDGNQIRVTAQFINAKDGSHLWSFSSTRELSNIFTLQEELADSISRTLLISLNLARKKENRQVNEEAYNYYLLGKYHRELAGKAETRKENLYKSADMFKKAIELDEQFVEAYVELGSLYSHFGFLYGTSEIPNVWELSESFIKKALEMDPNNSEGLRVQGYILRNQYWDWEGARKYYQKSLAASPSNVNTLNAYSLLLCALNELDSALYYSNRSLEFDKTSVSSQLGLLRTYFYSRQFELAKSIGEKYNLKANNVGSTFLFYILISTDKDKAVEIMLTDYTDKEKAEFIEIYQENGWEALMRSLYRKSLEDGKEPHYSVLSYGAPADDTISYLNKLADNKVGGLVYLLVHPTWDPVRNDPRFDELLKRMGLYKYK